MIDQDQHTIKAIDSMVAVESLSAKLQLDRVYSALELFTTAVVSILALYYYYKHNTTITSFLIAAALIITYNVVTLKFFPSATLKRTHHYWLLSITFCAGLLWFGLEGAYWAIPIVGSAFYVLPTKNALYLSCAIILYLICIAPLFNDITTAFRAISILTLTTASTSLYSIALKKQQQTLALRSITDPLTGAFNRLYLNHTLALIIEKQQQDNISSTIALLDINDFKHVNTTYGHDGGDKALIRLVEIVKAYTPRKHHLFRYGGDEFIIVFEGCSEQEADQHITLIQKALRHLEKKPKEIPISFSTGFATTTPDTTLEDLLNGCDQAMYNDKRVQFA